MRQSGRKGFTLVELLVVIALIVALTALMSPAVNSLKGANDLSSAASDISSMVQFCRSYAMANNTYVYLGIGEFDSSRSDSGPQINGVGRVAMVAIASRDGTRGYSPYAALISDVQTGWNDTLTGYRNGANFIAISKLQHYENLHLFDYGQVPPATGNMARPAVSGSANYLVLGNSASDTVTPITYPLGVNPRYTFSKALQFDPEGMVRLAPKSPPPPAGAPPVPYSAQGVPSWIELALIKTHGSVAPNISTLFPSPESQNIGAHVALMIDGMKGTVRSYRP